MIQISNIKVHYLYYHIGINTILTEIINDKSTIIEGLFPIIIQLISGATGGNLAGSLMKNLSLGTLGNSLAGILGGGLGGQLLGMIGMAGSAGMDISSIISSVAGGGVGGGVVMAIIGLIKNAMAKN